ncbi:DHH family phosphoesterase [Geopsychrobacter electrodiphilus]|uniref:DHH family phosphoesterase n=1 Tax=Geopsychrobacter electrodiphilus TaxID=225196 RepID=UPI0003720DA7|nr:DHH family phosphoesterase [Geopsychrobacter electrodiphilus]
MTDETVVSTETPRCCGSSVVEKLIDWIRGKGRILIVTHDNPDPDALAAAVALRHLLLMRTGEKAVVAFGGVIERSENRMMVDALELDVVPISELNFDDFGVTCMVDTQPGTGNNSYPENRPLHLLIDHHPPLRNYSDIYWVDVRPEYGASATILFEYLRAQGLSIATRLATCLFYALKSETQDLGREWSKADREAYLYLLPLANNQILYRLTHPPVSSTYYSTFHRAIENATVYGKVLVFNLFHVENPDLVAELADFLLRQKDVCYVLGLGCYKGDELLSVRTTKPEARLGSVIREMIAGMGTAGGHGMMAGGQIRGVAEDKSSQQELEHLLTRRYIKALGLQPEPGIALLETKP